MSSPKRLPLLMIAAAIDLVLIGVSVDEVVQQNGQRGPNQPSQLASVQGTIVDLATLSERDALTAHVEASRPVLALASDRGLIVLDPATAEVSQPGQRVRATGNLLEKEGVPYMVVTRLEHR